MFLDLRDPDPDSLDRGSDPAPVPTPFFCDFKDAKKKYFCHIFFL
jgi:hypothetical protein